MIAAGPFPFHRTGEALIRTRLPHGFSASKLKINRTSWKMADRTGFIFDDISLWIGGRLLGVENIQANNVDPLCFTANGERLLRFDFKFS